MFYPILTGDDSSSPVSFTDPIVERYLFLSSLCSVDVSVTT